MEYLAIVLMAIGGLFLMAGSLGVLRYEDVYLRIQFSSKSLTFGLCFFLAGTALQISGHEIGLKVLLAILFQFLTAPIAGTLIAQVALEHHAKAVKLENEEILKDIEQEE